MNIEKIWSEYQSGLKAFLHSKVANADEVDDLLQEILIKTFNNFHTIKSEESIKPWLYQIANNSIVDFYRKQAKSRDLTIEQLWYGEDDYDVKQSLRQCITPFINALPDETAALLTAIDIKEQSQKAYAEATGVSYSTLKSRVQKGRAELRALFEQCCHFSLDKQGNLADFDPKSDTCKNC
jgi:RNA polymerase sigma-70 factor (ECF subfamily)